MAKRVIDPEMSQLLEPQVAPENNGALATHPYHVPEVGEILMAAVEKGMPVETLEKLVALHERTADRKAAQEFAAAMAAFQADCPPIAKTSKANVMSQRTGSSHSYKYAELDEIARTVRPILHQHGLSYSWDSEEAAGKLLCICTIRHNNGHHQSAKFSCPTETAAAMSAQQKNAAALTYARRQSLIQALGLTTCDPDVDGRAPMSPKNFEPITEAQAAEIGLLLQETESDTAKFLKVFKVDRVEQLRHADYIEALGMLNEKKRRAAR